MRMKTMIVLALSLASLSAAAQGCRDTVETKTVVNEIQVVHNVPPQVPESMEFAGQKVDLRDCDRRERMDRELMTFTYMHTTSSLMLKRSARYFPVVEPILKEYGIPDDLKYLMVMESNLDPKAVSSAGAAGLWQFTKATAKTYGLEVRDGVDERFNIEKETAAACRYLRDAYRKFGDWMTVAASYNAGQAGIAKKLEEQHQTSAMDLWLVEETARYMYRVLAAKMLFTDPASFGFSIAEEDKYPYVEPREVVKVSETIPDLVKFADEHRVTYARLKAANLWLRDSKLDNPNGKEYRIVIPGF